MDLQEPAHLLDAREQALGARLVELAHAVAGEIEADADHTGVGELRERTVRDRRLDQRDALEPSAGGRDAVEHAAIVIAVRLRGDQQAVGHVMRVEHREKIRRGAHLARLRPIDQVVGKRISRPAENTRMAVGGAHGHYRLSCSFSSRGLTRVSVSPTSRV